MLHSAPSAAEFPDFILVDGRYRVACALESARPRVYARASSKLLFDDYALREQYHVVEKYIGPPQRIGRAALFTVGDREIPGDAIRAHALDAR